MTGAASAEFYRAYGAYLTPASHAQYNQDPRTFLQGFTFHDIDPHQRAEWLAKYEISYIEGCSQNLLQRYEKMTRALTQGNTGIKDGLTEQGRQKILTTIASAAAKAAYTTKCRIVQGERFLADDFAQAVFKLTFPLDFQDFLPHLQALPHLQKHYGYTPPPPPEPANRIRDLLSKKVRLGYIMTYQNGCTAEGFYRNTFQYLTKEARQLYLNDPSEFFKTATIHDIEPKRKQEFLDLMEKNLEIEIVGREQQKIRDAEATCPPDHHLKIDHAKLEQAIRCSVIDSMAALKNGELLYAHIFEPPLLVEQAMGRTFATNAFLFIPELCTQLDTLFQFLLYTSNKLKKPLGTFSEQESLPFLESFCWEHLKKKLPFPFGTQAAAAPQKKKGKKKKKKANKKEVIAQAPSPAKNREPFGAVEKASDDPWVAFSQQRLNYLNQHKFSLNYKETLRVKQAASREYEGSAEAQQMLSLQHEDLEGTTAILEAVFCNEYVYDYEYYSHTARAYRPAKGMRVILHLLDLNKKIEGVVELGIHQGEIYHRRFNDHPVENERDEEGVRFCNASQFFGEIPEWSAPAADDGKEDEGRQRDLMLDGEQRSKSRWDMLKPGSKNLFLFPSSRKNGRIMLEIKPVRG